jgi:hypothetical protein
MEGFMSEPTILIVDDESSISEVVTIYLQRAGYQVTVAHDDGHKIGSSLEGNRIPSAEYCDGDEYSGQISCADYIFNRFIFGRKLAPGARPLDAAWVTEIRDQCLRARVPFFFKQWGGVQKKRAGRILEGWTWDEMPVNMNLVKA